VLSPRGRHAIAAAVLAGALLPAAALGRVGYPEVHTPRLIDGPQEFGDSVSVYVGNSDSRTDVRVCVSGRCRRLTRHGDNRYLAVGALWNLNLRRGQRRTVLVIANNPNAGTMWGPTKVAVR
jgi:hypothetical protein